MFVFCPIELDIIDSECLGVFVIDAQMVLGAKFVSLG